MLCVDCFEKIEFFFTIHDEEQLKVKDLLMKCMDLLF